MGRISCRPRTGAAHLRQASLQLNVEAAVEYRVDRAVEQSQSLGESVDVVGDDEAVLGPYVN